jgi:NAD(P)-dependent dehydrogenase (short-subunit alcohol dehydrogenase family)
VPSAALVTGADSGIGNAIATRLVADGWALAFATRDDEADARAAYEVLATRGPVHWLVGDLRDPEVPHRIVDEASRVLGPLRGLVNNAGLSTARPVLDLSAEDFDVTFSVDVRAAFLLSQAFARQAPDGASIVNITSVHELVPRPNFAVYAAAKAALGMLSRGLALELAASGLRVNAVAPGAIATERNVEADELIPEIPLGRPGTPEEVAAAVAWLLSDEAAYVTGTTLVVDGGLTQQVVTRPAG